MKNKLREKIIHGTYTRKSSESEDRQVQSIERQKDDLLDLIEREELETYGNILEETKSAFTPGREIFKQLVKDTHKGKINAWLCWHANRLSRNPIDAGEIIYLMDIGKLKYIKTPSRIYHNTPGDKMMLQFEFTLSKKDSDDKSNFVKSGLNKRYKKGYPCGRAVTGYLNDKSKEKGDRGWIVDEERFKKVQKLFDRFLRGRDSVSSITDYAKNTLELTTPKYKRQGGILVGRSMIHNILRNPVYAGFFYSKDAEGHGRTLRLLSDEVPTIISEEDHIRILNMLGLKSHTNMQSHLTPYSGVLKGAKGENFGADVKLQVICDCRKKFAYRNKEYCPSCGVKIENMKKPKYLCYTYYINLERKRTKGISARGIEEKKVDKFVVDYFNAHLKLPEKIMEWTKQHLDKLKDINEDEKQNKIKTMQNKLKRFDLKIARTKQLFQSGNIDLDEYEKDVQEIVAQKDRHKEKIGREKKGYAELEKLLSDMVRFDDIIKNGDYKAKKEALSWFHSNLSWNEEKLSITRLEWLDVYINGRKNLFEKYEAFEPKNKVINKGQNDLFKVTCPTVLGWLDTLRKIIPKK